MKKILVLNGPNLNLLGTREPDIYGSMTLEQLEKALREQAHASGFRLDAFQSNDESALIEAIHKAGKDHVDYIIFNPAAFTHTSIALRDALLAVGIPFLEVHLSNIAAREPFRRQSWFSDIAAGVISGFGPPGYMLALTAIVSQFTKRES